MRLKLSTISQVTGKNGCIIVLIERGGKVTWSTVAIVTAFHRIYHKITQNKSTTSTSPMYEKLSCALLTVSIASRVADVCELSAHFVAFETFTGITRRKTKFILHIRYMVGKYCRRQYQNGRIHLVSL